MNTWRSSCTYVCWGCRKVTKYHAKCPHCGNQMIDMGKRWKAPRRGHDRRWKEQQRLYETGFRPDGTARTYGRTYSYQTCRWCGQRRDAEHEAKVEACRPPNWSSSRRWGWKSRQ